MSLQFKNAPNSPNPREHLVNRPHENRKGLTEHEIYNRKQRARLIRQKQIEQDKIKQQFFDWIDNIQAKLKLSNAAFASRICQKGGQATCQTVKLWKRRWGHYPNDQNYRALRRLAKEAKTEVIDLIFKIRIVSR